MPKPNNTVRGESGVPVVKNAAVPGLRLKEEANGKVYQAADPPVREASATAARAAAETTAAVKAASASASVPAANVPPAAPAGKPAAKAPGPASIASALKVAAKTGVNASTPPPQAKTLASAPAPVPAAEVVAKASASVVPGAKAKTAAKSETAKAPAPSPGAVKTAVKSAAAVPAASKNGTEARNIAAVPVAAKTAARAPASAPAGKTAVKTSATATKLDAPGQDAESVLKTQLKQQLNTVSEAGVKPELSPIVPAGKDGSTMKQPEAVKAQPVAGTAGKAEVKPDQGIKPGVAEEDAAIKLAKAGEARAPSFFERISSYWQNLSFKVKVSLLFVLLPGAVSYIYFAFLASPMYIAEAKFAVKGTASSSPAAAMGMGGGSSLFATVNLTSMDAMVVEEYLKTVDSFYAIDHELNLKEHYSSESYDYISRMCTNPTHDEIQKYWNEVSSVEINTDSGVVTFTVRAYTPEMALAVAKSALKESEKLVNSMNERSKDDALSLAREEVEAAEKRLAFVQNQLKTFRTEHKVLDVKSSAEGMEGLILQLESQAAEVKTQIAENELYMQSDTPALKALRAKLRGIEQQIEAERVRLTNINETGNSLNSLVSQYETLNTEAEFASQQLVAAMTSQEQAKIELLSKSLYLVTVAEPRLPDESLYPEPFMFSFYLMLTLAMAYLIGSVLLDAIREHMGL